MAPRLTIPSSADALLIAAALEHLAKAPTTLPEGAAQLRELAEVARGEYASDMAAFVADLMSRDPRDFNEGVDF